MDNLNEDRNYPCEARLTFEQDRLIGRKINETIRLNPNKICLPIGYPKIKRGTAEIKFWIDGKKVIKKFNIS